MSDIFNRYLSPHTSGPKNTVTITGLTNSSIDLLSVDEAAKNIEVTTQAIRKAIVEGRLIARKVGKQWVIDKADFETFKDRRRP